LCEYRDTTVTLYILDKDGRVLAEYGQQTNAPLARYVYAGDRRIAMYNTQGTLLFYLSDHLGSARVVMGSNGTVYDKYCTWAFGETRTETVSTNQRYRYTGKPFRGWGRRGDHKNVSSQANLKFTYIRQVETI
jgi:hypothetical protein